MEKEDTNEEVTIVISSLDPEEILRTFVIVASPLFCILIMWSVFRTHAMMHRYDDDIACNDSLKPGFYVVTLLYCLSVRP